MARRRPRDPHELTRHALGILRVAVSDVEAQARRLEASGDGAGSDELRACVVSAINALTRAGVRGRDGRYRVARRDDL